MAPPDCYNEPTRLHQVSKYIDLPHWHEPQLFRKTISKLRKTLLTPGVAISIIDNHKCHYKIETMLDMKDIPRKIAIDSHAILSHGYFCILDTTKDWRTSLNPLVIGTPKMKFYCGVPLLSKPTNQVIGILSIFDHTPKESFLEENCLLLQQISRDIITTLHRPIDELRAQISKRAISGSYHDRINAGYGPNMELSSLRDQIGRPTSSRSLLIFEKDGSGGPYIANQNFRFLNYSKSIKALEKLGSINEKHLWDVLFSIGSLKDAGGELSKILATTYHFEYVYILEIRIAEPYQIPKEYFPHDETKLEAESYKYTNKMIKHKSTHDEFMTRVIGSFGPNHPGNHFEHPIHYKAFLSEFGVEYCNPKVNLIYNRGILVPFYRQNSRIVRRSSDKDKRFVDVYLRSGGYLVALFSEPYNREINDELVSNVFTHASVYRKIYLST